MWCFFWWASLLSASHSPHGRREIVMSELQRDIFTLDVAADSTMSIGQAEAWQRLKPRLTPDRERVAIAIMDVLNDHGWETDRHDRPALLQAADAAIDAMGEAKP
jgi:hypothetical protein